MRITQEVAECEVEGMQFRVCKHYDSRYWTVCFGPKMGPIFCAGYDRDEERALQQALQEWEAFVNDRDVDLPTPKANAIAKALTVEP